MPAEHTTLCHYCNNNLHSYCAVIRTYLSETKSHTIQAQGHYSPSGNFIADSFDGFGGKRFDLPKDPDTCAACEQIVSPPGGVLPKDQLYTTAVISNRIAPNSEINSMRIGDCVHVRHLTDAIDSSGAIVPIYVIAPTDDIDSNIARGKAAVVIGGDVGTLDNLSL